MKERYKNKSTLTFISFPGQKLLNLIGGDICELEDLSVADDLDVDQVTDQDYRPPDSPEQSSDGSDRASCLDKCVQRARSAQT